MGVSMGNEKGERGCEKGRAELYQAFNAATFLTTCTLSTRLRTKLLTS